MADEKAGNGLSGQRVEEIDAHIEANMFKVLQGKLKALQDEGERALAGQLLDVQNVEEMVSRLRVIRRGSALDNLLLAGSAVAGLVVGYKVQSWVDLRAGSWVPVPGVVLGALGVVPGLAMDGTVTTRNMAGLGGVMAAAGAVTYTLTHPLAPNEGI